VEVGVQGVVPDDAAAMLAEKLASERRAPSPFIAIAISACQAHTGARDGNAATIDERRRSVRKRGAGFAFSGRV
jgi:hypothetical protein